MENCSYLVLGEESHCHSHGNAVDLELTSFSVLLIYDDDCKHVGPDLAL